MYGKIFLNHHRGMENITDSLPAVGLIRSRIASSLRLVLLEEDGDHLARTLTDRLFSRGPGCDCRVLTCQKNQTEEENAPGFCSNRVNTAHVKTTYRRMSSSSIIIIIRTLTIIQDLKCVEPAEFSGRGSEFII